MYLEPDGSDQANQSLRLIDRVSKGYQVASTPGKTERQYGLSVRNLTAGNHALAQFLHAC
jgi:hypothetical protein